MVSSLRKVEITIFYGFTSQPPKTTRALPCAIAYALSGQASLLNQAKYIVGPWLNFDGEAEHFTGDHSVEANRLLSDPRRAEFDIPSPAYV